MTAATLERAKTPAAQSPHNGGEAIGRRARRLLQMEIDFVPNSEFAI